MRHRAGNGRPRGWHTARRRTSLEELSFAEKGRDRGFDARRHAGNMLFLLVCFLVLARILSMVTGVATPFATVSSGSMEPALSVGDIVLWTPAGIDDVRVGDIVLYHSAVGDDIIIHRVMDIVTTQDGSPALITRGDANEFPDQMGPSNRIEPPVTGGMLLGRVVTMGDIPLKVPLLGSLWMGFTSMFPTTPAGLAVGAYAVVVLVAVYAFITPEDRPLDRRKRRVVSVILGRRPLRLLSAALLFFLLMGVVIAMASSASTQSTTVSVGVDREANPADIRIDHLDRLASFNASLIVSNPSGIPMLAVMFVEGDVSELVGFHGRSFELAPHEQRNITVPLNVPSGTAGVRNGRIVIYFSALWLLVPSDASAHLVSGFGSGSITLMNMLVAAEITLLLFTSIYLFAWAREVLDPHIFFWRMRRTRRRIPPRRRRPSPLLSTLVRWTRRIIHWFDMLPLFPVERRRTSICAFVPVLVAPLAYISPYASVLSGLAMFVLATFLFERTLPWSLSAGLLAGVTTLLMAMLAPSNVMLAVLLVAPLSGMTGYALGMRWRGEIISAAELTSFILVTSVLLMPLPGVLWSGGYAAGAVVLLQTVGIALIVYLLLFLPVMLLAYLPPLLVHTWRERDDPLVRITEYSDI